MSGCAIMRQRVIISGGIQSFIKSSIHWKNRLSLSSYWLSDYNEALLSSNPSAYAIVLRIETFEEESVCE